MIKAKRVYDAPEPTDGCRILVDRIWPRGISKKNARLDKWLKDIAPSTALRKWFSHDPAKWEGFSEKYKAELGKKYGLLMELKKCEREKGIVTLLYATKDMEHNNACVVRDILQKPFTA